MKVQEKQLTLFKETPPPCSSPLKKETERTRDSCGQFATDLQVANNRVEYLKNENEMLTRKYLILTKQLTTTQRELLTLKNITK